MIKFKEILYRYTPLLLFLITWIVGFIYFRVNDTDLRNDKTIIVVLVGCALLSSVLQIILTQQWTTAALGLLGFVAGTGFLYALIMWGLYDWNNPPKWLTDAGRGGLVPGAVLLFIAMLLMAYETITNRKSEYHPMQPIMTVSFVLFSLIILLLIEVV